MAKHYSVSHSSDLAQFESINTGWMGDGAVRALTIHKTGMAQSFSPIRADFWADLTGSDMDALYAVNYPHAPDGSAFAQHPEAPRFAASHYAARLHFRISPPGGRQLYLLPQLGGAALHRIDDTGTERSAIKIAEILPLQEGLQPGKPTARNARNPRRSTRTGNTHSNFAM